MWWQPSLCAFVRVWERGISGVAVECIWIEEAPEAERICVGVTAREKMSVRCAVVEHQHVCGSRGARKCYHHRLCAL
jgi:hypothetical protein